jgi:very-short-patch-repair endonuclease
MRNKTAHNKYWTKELVISEAQKHQTQSEWRKAGGGSMGAARENGWIQEATAHMISKQKPNGYWTKERVLEEAKKYSYQTEWIKAGGGSFSIAQKKKWLAEACAHMKSPKVPMGYWTKERLIDDAKKYKSRVEWKKANGSAYATAGTKGYLEECCVHMELLVKPVGYWNKERCIESAKKYPTIIAWSVGENGAYDAAKGKPWYAEATKHMVKTFSHGEYTIYSFLLSHDIKFTYQKRFKDLKDKGQLPYDFYIDELKLVIEYQGRQHFGTSKTSLFRKNAEDQPRRDAIKKVYAEKNELFYIDIETQKTEEIEKQLIDKIREIEKFLGKTILFKRRELTNPEKNILGNLGVWKKEAVLNDALKYKTLKDWSSNGNAASQIAYKNGWIKEATAHMHRTQMPKGYWTKERVLKSALNYQSSTDWIKGERGAWSKAQANGWLEEATAHMPNRPKKKLPKPKSENKIAV